MVARSDNAAHSRVRSHSPVDGRSSPPVIFPRRKAGQNKRPATHHPVVVTYEILSQQFDVPLWKACRSLGICATAMKKVCRKLGVMKWPYKENHMPGKKCSSHKHVSSPTASVASQDSATEDSPNSPVQTPPIPMGSSRRTPTAARPVATRAAPFRGSTRAASAAAAVRVAALCAREQEPIESGSEVSTPQAATPADARQYEEEYECDARPACQPVAPRRYEGPEEEEMVTMGQPSRPQAQINYGAVAGDVAMAYGQPAAPVAAFYGGYPVVSYPACAPVAPEAYCAKPYAAFDYAPAAGGRIATGFEAPAEDDYYSSDGWLEEPDLMGACCEDFCYPGEEAQGGATASYNSFLMCF